MVAWLIRVTADPLQNEPFFAQTVVKVQKEIIGGEAAGGGGGKSARAARTVRVLEGGDLKLQCEVLPGKTPYDGHEEEERGRNSQESLQASRRNVCGDTTGRT